MSRHVTKPENSPPQSSIQTGTPDRSTARTARTGHTPRPLPGDGLTL